MLAGGAAIGAAATRCGTVGITALLGTSPLIGVAPCGMVWDTLRRLSTKSVCSTLSFDSVPPEFVSASGGRHRHCLACEAASAQLLPSYDLNAFRRRDAIARGRTVPEAPFKLIDLILLLLLLTAEFLIMFPQACMEHGNHALRLLIVLCCLVASA